MNIQNPPQFGQISLVTVKDAPEGRFLMDRKVEKRFSRYGKNIERREGMFTPLLYININKTQRLYFIGKESVSRVRDMFPKIFKPNVLSLKNDPLTALKSLLLFHSSRIVKTFLKEGKQNPITLNFREAPLNSPSLKKFLEENKPKLEGMV